MLRGSFGPVHPFSIVGWAYDPDDLSVSLDIEVKLDGQTIRHHHGQCRHR